MRAGLPVREPLGRQVAVLAPEGLERPEQLLDLEATVRSDVPGRLLGDGHLADVGQRARDHLPVDGVGDLGEPAARGDQTEADDIGEVIIEDIITIGLSLRECRDSVLGEPGTIVGAACLIDRSAGRAELGMKLVSLMEYDVPDYAPDELPPELAAIPAIKPGSRGLSA